MNVDPIPTRNVTLPKLAKGINQLHACQEATNAKVDAAAAIIDDLKSDVDFIKRLPRRVLWWIALSAISAFIGLFVQNIILHNSTVQQVQQSTSTVTAAVHGNGRP